MKLFQNLFGKGGIEIAAPVSGKLVAISKYAFLHLVAFLRR